jgi:hypothetical protein
MLSSHLLLGLQSDRFLRSSTTYRPVCISHHSIRTTCPGYRNLISYTAEHQAYSVTYFVQY